MNITQIQLEILGCLKDKADNLIAATSLPLSPVTHIQCLTAGLEDLSKEIRDLVVDISGKDPWSGHPGGCGDCD